MKRTLLHNVEQLRYFAMLLIVAWCGTGIASALESDDINDAILVEGSTVIPKWTDDATNPWIISTHDGTTCLRTPESDTQITTTLSMTFESTYAVDLNFIQYFRRNYNSESFKLVIDGEEYSYTSAYWSNNHKIIPAGSHKIDFIVTTQTYNDYYYGAIASVKLMEYRPLETACVKAGSMPITFVNDPEHPWLTEDGYIRSMNNDISNSSSTISTTISVDKASLFSYQYRSVANDNYNYTYIRVNGVDYESSYRSSWNNGSIVLYPGSYNIEFENSHRYSDNSYYTEIRNVCLTQDWINITLNQPGELATRLIQALGDKNLQDAELVKISGSLNNTDWTTITQLTGIKSIDFSETDITAIPSNAFANNTLLNTVILPETLLEIGSHAFQNTDINEMTIPSSVQSIGESAWENTPLTYIHFAENSVLNYIGYAAFRNTRIIEFDMPDSVTEVGQKYDGGGHYGSDIFENCKSLKRLHLSDGLASVPNDIAYGCSSLTEVNIPINAKSIGCHAFYGTGLMSIDIPESVTSIGNAAFYESKLETITIPKNVSSYGASVFTNCKNLKEAILNSHCWNMDYTFSNCTALEKVVLPCATPPSISDDPFYGVTKANVRLVVPEFALQSYRTNTYWYNFTNSVAGDEASLYDYWAIRGDLALDSSNALQGTPSVEIMNGGTLTMDTDMTQGFDDFTFNTRESSPGAFLSKSNNLTANKIVTKFYVDTANKWFFFSPVADINMADVTYPSTDSWVIRYYDGARRGVQNDNTGNWANVPADGVLKKGQGYIIQAASAGWLYMPVAADKHDQFFGSNQVDFELADNPSDGEANAGWNFVSNPYPCYYDIYYIDMQAPITVWNGSTYRAYSLNDGDRGDDTFVLRPMQPFFVQKATADLSTGMPLTGRRTSTVIDRTRAPKRDIPANNEFRNKLNLELFAADKEEADDYTRIVINEEASLDYEKLLDASKFMSMDSKVAQLFSLGNDNTPMSINERPYDNGIVALGVYLPVSGESYTISATRADRQAWLHDAVTGIEHDLTAADYVFTANKEGFDYNRFSIRFAPGATAVETINGVQVKVTAANGAIIVTAADDAEVAIYATDGTNVANATGSAEISVTAGIYVVKVNGETFKTIVK